MCPQIHGLTPTETSCCLSLRQYDKSSEELQKLQDCLNKIVSLWGSPWISALDSFPLLRVTHLILTPKLLDVRIVLTLFCISFAPFFSSKKLPNPPFSRLMKEVARRDELIRKHIEEFKVRMNAQMINKMLVN